MIRLWMMIRVLCLPLCAQVAHDSTTGRQEVDFNRDWQFVLPVDSHAKAPAADATWEAIGIPHTMRLEPRNANGCRNYMGVGFYRKNFMVDEAWKGRKIYIRFEGAMQVAEICLNGKPVATHYGGYLPFTIDLTDLVQHGQMNTLEIRLDTSDNAEVPPGTASGRLGFTRFGGIYRNVRLILLDRLHITDELLAGKVAGGGIFVSYPLVTKEKAQVSIKTDIVNELTALRKGRLKQEILDSKDQCVAEVVQDFALPAGGNESFTQGLTIVQPKLWHPNHPDLYTLRTSILTSEGAVTDQRRTRIGIRHLSFKPEGLFINGEKFFASGINRHQDHPYVGYAMPDSAEWRDAKKLREAGFTSFRCHYPMSPAWMDACDELGILCVVSSPGWQFFGNNTWKQRFIQDTRDMIRDQRNRPCAVLWEPFPNESSYNESFARQLYDIAHAEFPGDQCFVAGDGKMGNAKKFIEVVWERDLVKDKAFWGREWGDNVDNWSDQQGRVRVARGWGEAPMLTQAINHAVKLDALLRNNGGSLSTTRSSGAGLWAAIDTYMAYTWQEFLGAPLDLFRLPKFDYYFFQSQRDPNIKLANADSGPMVFIANFATAYSPAAVTVFSNCEEVRFYENGKLVATQKPDAGYIIAHPPFTFQAKAPSSEVSPYNMTTDIAANASVGYHYQAASFKAEGLIDGKVVATHRVTAPGMPRKVILEADLCGRPLTADGVDWVRVYAKVCDGRGTVYPFSSDMVTFTVAGEGSVISDARIGANPVPAEAGIATALIRSHTKPGKLTIKASIPGLETGELTIESMAKSF